MLITTALLAVAICSVWLPEVHFRTPKPFPIWIPLLLAATVSAFIYGLVDWRGVVAILTLVGAALGSVKASQPIFRRSLGILAFLLAFAMGIRVVPGFASSVFVENLRLTPDATAMRLTAHFDQGVAGLVLLAVYCKRLNSIAELRAIVRPTLLISAITITAVMLLAMVVGYLRFDPKLPEITFAHLAKIALWTAVLEEALFRGIIQERLMSMEFARNRRTFQWLAIAISSVLFGLAHIGGGWIFVGLATAAGVGYSISYAMTRRIEAAMFTHFLLNAVHFVGFTYPHLA